MSFTSELRKILSTTYEILNIIILFLNFRNYKNNKITYYLKYDVEY
jgi:hypothetical protein